MQAPETRPTPHRADPRLTVLPALSAPIDEGVLIPKPPRSAADRLVLMLGLTVLAAAVLAFAFLAATPMR